ncbi:alpha/beta hydrolase fold precursor [Vibrio ishigakensis]|uniref:Alpha/beta hydrolase fold n=1 Tax=Vibrio ishigakensis TaxID=1481914 RepID=A0A0B8PNN8_9VIBR|nr:alpha/beta hydrolase fold precursor [Vibrio ishigakensis]
MAMLPRWLSHENRYLSEVLKASPDIQTIRLRHGDTHYQLKGESHDPVVVLVHGFSVPSFAWEANQEALIENGFQVLSFDLYGRGFSARPSVKYSQTLFVEQLNDLLQALNIHKPVHLVGLSMGGAVVSFFNKTYPDKVASTCLLAPFSKPIPIGPLKLPVLGRYLAYVFYIPSMLKNQIKDFVKPEMLDYWQGRYEEQMSIKGFRNAIFSSANYAIQEDPQPAFHSFSGKPCLLLWGREDELFPLEESKLVRESLGDSHEFQIIDEAGHGLQFEQADRVNQALIEFLKKHS